MGAWCIVERTQVRPAFAPVRLVAIAMTVVACATTTWAQGSEDVGPQLKQCGACHGEDGNSAIPNIPSLAGQPEFFLLNQLILMREGVRRIDVMTPLVAPLTDDQIAAIARYFAAQEPKASGEPIDASITERGAALATKLRCASCHRADFGGQDQMPRLAKQRIDYLISSMRALRDDERSGADTLMTAAINGVSDADLIAVAHYVAAPQRP